MDQNANFPQTGFVDLFFEQGGRKRVEDLTDQMRVFEAARKLHVKRAETVRREKAEAEEAEREREMAR